MFNSFELNMQYKICPKNRENCNRHWNVRALHISYILSYSIVFLYWNQYSCFSSHFTFCLTELHVGGVLKVLDTWWSNPISSQFQRNLIIICTWKLIASKFFLRTDSSIITTSQPVVGMFWLSRILYDHAASGMKVWKYWRNFVSLLMWESWYM